MTNILIGPSGNPRSKAMSENKCEHGVIPELYCPVCDSKECSNCTKLLDEIEQLKAERDEACKREYHEGLQKVFWMKKYCVSEACRRRVEPGVIAIEEHLSPYLFQPEEQGE